MTDIEALSDIPLEIAPRGIGIQIQAIAPEYEHALLTVTDRYGVESKWVMQNGAGPEDIADCIERHISLSQVATRRN